MELKQSFTINGVVVVPTEQRLGNLIVYKKDDNEWDLTLYFVDDLGMVVGTLNVEADMSQGVGYVSDWSIS